jgi:hypothetical protein
MLNTTDTFTPTNVVRYSFKDKSYKTDSSVTHTRVHFTLDSKSTYRDPLAFVPADGEAGAEGAPATASTSTSTSTSTTPAAPPKLANAFNYSALASQTTPLAPKTVEVNTDPIEFQDFQFTVTQWEIFDSYMQDQERQKAERDVKGKRGGPGKKGVMTSAAAGGTTPLIPIPQPVPMPPSAVQPSGGGVTTTDADARAAGEESGPSTASGAAAVLPGNVIPTAAQLATSTASAEEKQKSASFDSDPHVLQTLQVMERMALQNTFDDFTEDFKFWEDPSDVTKGDVGTLMPLWVFAPARKEAKRKAATCLVWHPKYTDFFGVGYGSFEFNKQTGGAVAIYTLKNHLYPEYFFTFDSGVVSFDWNKKVCSLPSPSFQCSPCCLLIVSLIFSLFLCFFSALPLSLSASRTAS